MIFAAPEHAIRFIIGVTSVGEQPAPDDTDSQASLVVVRVKQDDETDGAWQSRGVLSTEEAFDLLHTPERDVGLMVEVTPFLGGDTQALDVSRRQYGHFPSTHNDQKPKIFLCGSLTEFRARVGVMNFNRYAVLRRVQICASITFAEEVFQYDVYYDWAGVRIPTPLPTEFLIKRSGTDGGETLYVRVAHSHTLQSQESQEGPLAGFPDYEYDREPELGPWSDILTLTWPEETEATFVDPPHGIADFTDDESGLEMSIGLKVIHPGPGEYLEEFQGGETLPGVGTELLYRDSALTIGALEGSEVIGPDLTLRGDLTIELANSEMLLSDRLLLESDFMSAQILSSGFDHTFRHYDEGFGGQLNIGRARGTRTAPEVVVDGDPLGSVRWDAYIEVSPGVESFLTVASIFSIYKPSQGSQLRLYADKSIHFVGDTVFASFELLTTATGPFPYLPSMPGVPTGTPVAFSGTIPIVIDSANNRLYANIASSWVNLSGGGSPDGSGSELQFRATGTTFGAVTGSSVSGADLTLAGSLTLNTADSQTIFSGTTFDHYLRIFDDGFGGQFTLGRARGSRAMPGAISDGDVLGLIRWQGYYGGSPAWQFPVASIYARYQASSLSTLNFYADGAIQHYANTVIDGYTLTVQKNGSPFFVFDSAQDNSSSGSFRFVKSRGTLTSRAAAVSDDNIGQFDFNLYVTGSVIRTGAAITAQASGTVDGSNWPTDLLLKTNSTTVGTHTALRLTSAQYAGFGRDITKAEVVWPVTILSGHNTTDFATLCVYGSIDRERIELRSVGGSPIYMSKRANGSIGGESVPVSGNILGGFGASGWDTNGWYASQTGAMFFLASETWTTTSHGTHATIYSTPSGSVSRLTRVQISDSGDVVLNMQAALSTSATAAFTWLPHCSGAPTNAPTASYSGAIATVIDSANNRLYARISGAWVNLSAGGYTTVRDEGSALTARATLNFVGNVVSAADDSGNSRTNVTINAVTFVDGSGSELQYRTGLYTLGALSNSSVSGSSLTLGGALTVQDSTHTQTIFNTIALDHQFYYYDDGFPGQMTFYRGRGSRAFPGNLSSGDGLGKIQFQGYVGGFSNYATVFALYKSGSASELWLQAERAVILDGNRVFATATLLTTATDGFVWMPSCAGVPTGSPTAYTGGIPIVIDTSNSRLYARISGSWVNLTSSGGGSPAGSGTEIQYRNGSSFAALASSSVSGADLTLGGILRSLSTNGQSYFDQFGLLGASYYGSGGVPEFWFTRGRNTLANPQATVVGDNLSVTRHRYHDGSFGIDGITETTNLFAANTAIYRIKALTNNVGPSDRLILSGHKTLTNNTATDLFKVSYSGAEKKYIGALLVITAGVKNASDVHSITRVFVITSIHWNSGGFGQMEAAPALDNGTADTVSDAGTITLGLSFGNGDEPKCIVTVNSSLSSTTQFEVIYNLICAGEKDITLL